MMPYTTEELLEEVLGEEVKGEEEVEEEEELEEEEEQVKFELEDGVLEPIIPKKRGRGQLKLSLLGSEDIPQVTDAQVHQISDQVAQKVSSSLNIKLPTKRKKKGSVHEHYKYFFFTL